MRLAIDTNRYTDLANSLPEVVRTLEAAETIFVPFITIAELRSGFAMGKRGKANEQILLSFLAKPNIVPLYPDERTTTEYASVYQHLRKQGTPIPTNGIWIAALVLQHDLRLYARDAHFDHLPQIQRA